MAAPRLVFDAADFEAMVAARHFLVAIATVEIAVLDLPGQHRQRADLVRVTREWLDDPATIPTEAAAVAHAAEVSRERARLIAGTAGPFWGRLADVLEARARAMAEPEPVG